MGDCQHKHENIAQSATCVKSGAAEKHTGARVLANSGCSNWGSRDLRRHLRQGCMPKPRNFEGGTPYPLAALRKIRLIADLLAIA